MNLEAQSSTDTICLPTKIARALLVDAQRHDLLKSEVAILNERIKEKETQLSLTTTRDSLIIASLKREIFELESQKSLLINQSDSLTKQLKKARRKQRLTAFAGIATTIAGIVFIK